jgi:hypothetical protein
MGLCGYTLHCPSYVFRAYDTLFLVFVSFGIILCKHAPCCLDLSFVLGRDVMLLCEFGTTWFGRLLALCNGSGSFLGWLFVRSLVSGYNDTVKPLNLPLCSLI